MNIKRVMTDIQRSSRGAPEVRLRLAESGVFVTEIMPTDDQAHNTVVSALRRKGQTDISLDGFVEAVNLAKTSPVHVGIGKTPEEAFAELANSICSATADL